MKKLLIILSLFLSFENINAQSEDFDGYIFLGGSLSFSAQKNQVPYLGTILGIPGASYSSNPNDSHTYSFSFSSHLGKEINQHWALGWKLLYRNKTFKSKNPTSFGIPILVDIKQTSHQIGTGVFARYTFNPDKKFNLFIQPYTDINSVTELNKSNNAATSDRKINYLTVGLDGGILYNINKKFRATASVGGLSYAAEKWKDLLNDDSDNFMVFNSSIRTSSISLGLELKL